MIQPQQLANRIIATATDFVGLVEREENSHWDDPRTPYRDVDKDVWLRTWMGKISGWEPGAPYCVAFDGAVIHIVERSCAHMFEVIEEPLELRPKMLHDDLEALPVGSFRQRLDCFADLLLTLGSNEPAAERSETDAT